MGYYVDFTSKWDRIGNRYFFPRTAIEKVGFIGVAIVVVLAGMLVALQYQAYLQSFVKTFQYVR